MKVRVLYFAALREALGRDREEVELPPTVSTVQDLREWMRQRGEPFASRFSDSARLRAAVNQSTATADARLSEGSEVAFFPPVTGG